MSANLVWTNHVEERLRQRGISRDEAWETIRYPDKTEKLASDKWKFFKQLHGKNIVIVAAIDQGQYVIVTSWVKDFAASQQWHKQRSRMSTADKAVWSILSWFGRGLRRLLTGK